MQRCRVRAVAGGVVGAAGSAVGARGVVGETFAAVEVGGRQGALFVGFGSAAGRR